MYGLYLLSVWLHLLAAVVWMGGMVFLVLVLCRSAGGQSSAAARQR